MEQDIDYKVQLSSDSFEQLLKEFFRNIRELGLLRQLCMKRDNKAERGLHLVVTGQLLSVLEQT